MTITIVSVFYIVLKTLKKEIFKSYKINNIDVNSYYMEAIRHFELAMDALVPTYTIVYIMVVNCVFDYIKVNIIIGTHYIDTRIPELNVFIFLTVPI